MSNDDQDKRPNDDKDSWIQRSFESFVTWFKANALNAGITLVVGYILGRVFH